MPGKNEGRSPAKLAKDMDQDYTHKALESFFGGFRGLRWDRITIQTVSPSGVYATGSVLGGTAVTCNCQVAIPVAGEEWWGMCGKDGVYYLDDIAR